MSSGGVLVESRHRLMPGATVELYLRRDKQPATVVRGRVVRCHVVRLGENTVRYHGAIAFERYLLGRFEKPRAMGNGFPSDKSWNPTAVSTCYPPSQGHDESDAQ